MSEDAEVVVPEVEPAVEVPAEAVVELAPEPAVEPVAELPVELVAGLVPGPRTVPQAITIPPLNIPAETKERVFNERSGRFDCFDAGGNLLNP